MSLPDADATSSGVAVSPAVQARGAGRVQHARRLPAGTVRRREGDVLRLAEPGDPDHALVARTFNDFLRQVDEMRRNGAALVVATGPDGAPVVGRHAVLDVDKEVVLVPWHAPVGQRQLLAADRLLASERPDGSVRLESSGSAWDPVYPGLLNIFLMLLMGALTLQFLILTWNHARGRR